MNDQPDLSFYFAIHDAQRASIDRYARAVESIDERDRTTRGKALARWARGFTFELEEHHYVEDAFFFPSLRSKVASAAPVLDRLDADHRALDEILVRWPAATAALADPAVPFAGARTDALAVAAELRDLLHPHLDTEDRDVLPLFWRHYTATEYDDVSRVAIRKGKKTGMWFVAPFTVDCFAAGPERDAFLASVPRILRLIHRAVRPSYDRMMDAAFGPVVAAVSRVPASARR